MVLLANQKYAAMVMDVRSGEILHSENANKQLHPAYLTKMMTLYVVFQAVENGEISLDKKIKISSKGGNLQFASFKDKLKMTGPATNVFSGTID